MPKAKLYTLFWPNYKVQFLKPVTLAATTSGYWDENANSRVEFFATNAISILGPGTQHRIDARSIDAFPGSILRVDGGMPSPKADPNKTTTGIFYMNGLDQMLDRIDNGTGANAFHGEGQEHGTVTTTSRAKLRLLGTGNAKTVCYLQGPIDLVWAPTNSSYVQIFSNRTHSISSSITVTNGVLRFDGKTTLASLPEITVKKDGVFILDTSLDNALYGLQRLTIEDNGVFTQVQARVTFTSGQCDLTLGENAKLAIPAGEYSFGSLTVGSELKPLGTYSGDPTSANYLKQLPEGVSVKVEFCGDSPRGSICPLAHPQHLVYTIPQSVYI